MADVSLLFNLLATNNMGGALSDAQAQLESLAATNDEVTASQSAGSATYKAQMAANRTALAEWIAETKELEAAEKEAYGMAASLAKTAAVETEAAGKSATSAFGGFKAVLSGILGAEALSGMQKFFSSTVSLANNAQKVAQQTAAVLASTGNAAGVTATQVGELSDKYGELAGVESLTVQNAMNSLLRSSGVDAALSSNTITADGLTSTLVNMAAAMAKGGATSDSLSTAASALSKALADPYTAAKALTAAGDPLTASQVAQIAAFKKAGDEAGAYKVVLGSLTSATAGAAAANTTPLQQLSVKWEDVKKAIGTDVIPMIQKFASIGVSAFGPIMSGASNFFGFISAHIAIFGSVAGAIGLVVLATKLWAGAERLVALAEALVDALDPYTAIYMAIIAVVAVVIYLMTKFSDFRTVVIDVIQDVMRVMGDLAQFIVNTVVGSVELLLKALGAIPIIGGPFKQAANDVDAFRTTVDNAISAVQNLDVAAGLSDLSGFLQSMTNFGGTAATNVGSGFSAAIPTALAGAAPAVETLAQKVTDALTKFKSGIVQSFGNMGSVISNAMLGPNGSSFLVGNLQQQLNKAKQFATDISTLRKMGLNATSLNELIAAGPDQGADAAHQLATQGVSQIQQVNSLETQFNTLGNQFATTTANDEFGSTAAALKRNQVYLNFDMTGVSTDDFVKALRKAIRVKGGNVQTVLGGAS